MAREDYVGRKRLQVVGLIEFDTSPEAFQFEPSSLRVQPVPRDATSAPGPPVVVIQGDAAPLQIARGHRSGVVEFHAHHHGRGLLDVSDFPQFDGLRKPAHHSRLTARSVVESKGNTGE